MEKRMINRSKITNTYENRKSWSTNYKHSVNATQIRELFENILFVRLRGIPWKSRSPVITAIQKSQE